MKSRKYNVVKSMEFNEDILITDPCYITLDNDWEKSNYGSNLEKLGIKDFITNTTYYGDWSCTVWGASKYRDCTSKTKIGEFCADAGLVTVMSYAQAVKYNPELPSWINGHDWCATVIKNFHGTVEFRAFSDQFEMDGKVFDDTTLEIFGLDKKGDVVFIAAQTGL